MTTSDEYPETDIAIVGIAGRFPGADDVDALWQRVAAGDDCLTDISLDDARAAGAAEADLNDPDYVRRSGMLDDVAGFDHEFFGIGSRDADVMDPQHRHFLECAWAALEMSTNLPETFDGAIGVFGGCGMNTYLINNLLTAPGVLENMGWFLLRHTGNDKDFLVNNVAYRLNLHGPAVNVQTACSTSLVAIHLGIQSLLTFESDLVLAGGATIEAPHGVGYRYHEGEILSADGHCRAFDANSGGTVLTSGAGVVALRRLSEAMDDGDPILAIIKGSAINNDGARKVGFLAPSVDGHADVVREALAVADLCASDIQLVEAHGTGTAVGDPIEVEALTEAFRSSTDDTGFCRLTSTKPNIGHLDTAAGVASVIKVVQALRNRTLPPMANHTEPSALVNWSASPFVVSGTGTDWPGLVPRRAGVSSLGVGGTNAHLLIEEAPQLAPAPPSAPEQTLAISALTKTSVDLAAAKLAEHLENNPTVELSDVAHTLVTGRRPMGHRRVITATDREAAIALLRTPDRFRGFSTDAADGGAQLGFMFPGGGSQYVGMGAGLDDRFATFHDARRSGADIVADLGGPDLRPGFSLDGDDEQLRRPSVSLPSVFVTSVALARQWMYFGAQPDVLLGHSLGEYVAAHLAGVISLEDALKLVVTRSQLMEQVGGSDTAMLVVPLDEERLVDMLPDNLSLATINAADECVVAGRAEHIADFADVLAAADADPVRIPLAAAAHSYLLDPVLDEFRSAVRSVALSAPQIPYPSNLTGTWITEAQVTNPDYWVDHLRGTVRFLDGVRTVCADKPTVLSELGPGHSLSSAARRTSGGPVGVAPALRHPNHEIDDTGFSLQAFARQWALGADVAIAPLIDPDRRKLALPTYAFDHVQHWIEPGVRADTVAASATRAAVDDGAASLERLSDLDDFTSIVEWSDVGDEFESSGGFDSWLVHAEHDDPAADQLLTALASQGVTASRVDHGTEVAVSNSSTCVISIAPLGDASVDSASGWFVEVAGIAAKLGAEPITNRLVAVTRSAFTVDGHAPQAPNAIISGVVRVAAREYDDLTGAVIDIDDATTLDKVANLASGQTPEILALRGSRLLEPRERSVSLTQDESAASAIKTGGNYLITGAFGGVGFTLAEHLARDHGANLAVLCREPLPVGAEAQHWTLTHGRDDPTSRRLRRLAQLESHGTKVEIVIGDTSSASSIADAISATRNQLGTLDGAVHSAGVMYDQILALATPEDFTRVIDPKLTGALALAEELERVEADLLILVGSTSALLAPAGQAAYAGVNAAIAQMAGRPGQLRTVAIDFGLWAVEGMATDAARAARLDMQDTQVFEHPILDVIGSGRDGSTVLAGRLDTRHHWALDEHRTGDDVPILPGTAHLDLMCTAAVASGIAEPALHDVLLLEPIVVPEGSVVPVRVTVVPGADAHVVVERDDGVEWQRCSEARLAPAKPSVERDPGSMPLQLEDPLEAQRGALHLGPRWDSVTSACRGEDAAQVSIDLSVAPTEVESWSLHPAIADLATAAAVALAPEAADSPGEGLWVPVRYEELRVSAPLAATVTATAMRRASQTEHLSADIEIRDPAGSLLVEIIGIELRQIEGNSFDALDTGTTAIAEHQHSLADLASSLGLTAHEGTTLLERIVAGPHDRVIASSLRLDDLRQLADEPQAEQGAASTGASDDNATVESTIEAIWHDLLGLDEVGPDDDFFELGGHSLIAIRLMSRIRKDTGVRLELTDLLSASTINTLAARVREVDPDVDARIGPGEAASAEQGTAAAATGTAVSARAPSPHLVTISPSGTGRPLYVVHGAGGNVLFLWSLARAMSSERPLYGFQAKGVQGDDLPDSSIEEMAERYVAELREHSPGPYLLGGFSGGGLVTLEMVRQLREFGEEVDLAILFDSAPAGLMKPGFSRRMQNLAGHLASGAGGSTMPYVKRGIRRRIARFRPPAPEGGELKQNKRDLGYADTEVHGYVNLFHYFTASANRYQMKKYEVDVLLVKADEVWPCQPHDYHWGAFIDGALDVVTVPGNHHSMFFPQFAPRLAASISPILQRYDEAESTPDAP